MQRADDGRGGANAGLLAQRRGNLVELDAEAAQLDLVVDASLAYDVTVGIDVPEVAGQVGAPAGDFDETGGGEFGAPEIPFRQAGTEHHDLTRLPGGQQGAVFAADADGVVRQGSADGDALARLQFRQGRGDGRLRRTIGVEYFVVLSGQPVRQRVWASLPAEVEQTDRRRQRRHQRHQRGDRMEDREPLRGQRRRHGIGVGDGLGRGDPERGAGEEGDPDLLDGHVERDRESLVDTVAGADPQDVILAAEEVADVALGDRDALRLTGRARGVDDVRDVGRRGPDGHAITGSRELGELERDEVALADGLGGSAMGQDEPSARVPHANREAVRGDRGVERQPRGARQGDADLGDDEVATARHPKPDAVPRPHPRRPQAGSDAFGPRQ